VLPVVVTCLLAAPGSLILLEQPELHLHPAAQQRLGDFLLACARSGRQLVVETHSEYVLSRLRLRVAEDEAVLGALAVYFGEQRDDVSEFRQVPLNEFGGIDEWPIGFFDQAAAESRKILEAALEKRDRRGREAETPISS
jgi:predicted ATPase